MYGTGFRSISTSPRSWMLFVQSIFNVGQIRQAPVVRIRVFVKNGFYMHEAHLSLSTARIRSIGKVMFSHESVILSTGGGGLAFTQCHWDAPPRMDAPTDGCTSPSQDALNVDGCTPTNNQKAVGQQASGTDPTGMHTSLRIKP